MDTDEQRRAAAAIVRSARLREEILDGTISSRTLTVLIRDGDECWLCGGILGETIGKHGTWPYCRPTLDHIIPASHGGKNALHNLKLAHSWCNAKRGADDCPRCLHSPEACKAAKERIVLQRAARKAKRDARKPKRVTIRFGAGELLYEPDPDAPRFVPPSQIRYLPF